MRHRYLISDHEHNPIAQAVLESPPGSDPMHLTVLDGAAERIAALGDICLLGMEAEDIPMRGRVGYRYGDCVVVAPGEQLSAKARMNLRVPTSFRSFFYPVSGDWRGKRPFVCHDLSCGGIAFHTTQPLEVCEVVQVLVAVMKRPLLVHTEILRPLPVEAGVEPLYASKFVDLCDDEVAAIRKAVFSIQLQDTRK